MNNSVKKLIEKAKEITDLSNKADLINKFLHPSSPRRYYEHDDSCAHNGQSVHYKGPYQFFWWLLEEMENELDNNCSNKPDEDNPQVTEKEKYRVQCEDAISAMLRGDNSLIGIIIPGWVYDISDHALKVHRKNSISGVVTYYDEPE